MIFWPWKNKGKRTSGKKEKVSGIQPQTNQFHENSSLLSPEDVRVHIPAIIRFFYVYQKSVSLSNEIQAISKVSISI